MIDGASLWYEAARRHTIHLAQLVSPNFKSTPFHQTYYKVLDLFAQGKVRNLIVQASPQHGKSQGSSRILPAYLLGINPDLKIAICSYAATIAKDFNRDVQRIIDSDTYAHIFPDTKLNSSNVVTVSSNWLRNSDVFEIVNHTGSLRVVGRGGSLTSKTVDILILDDLYKDSAEANSPVIREGAWDWYTKVARTRLHNDSQQLIVFTRWHPEDIIGRIIDSEKVITAERWDDFEDVSHDAWVLVNFEAIKTGQPTELDPREEGEPLWGERHSIERLLQQKELDPVGFECMFQGNPGTAEGRLFQPFKTWIERDDWGKYVRSGCYIDVADEGDDYLCAICYDIVKSDNVTFNEKTKRFEPLLFALVTDVVYSDEPTDVTLVTCARMINQNNTQKVYVESNNGGSQFEKNLKKKIRALTHPFYQSANKESRIISNAPLVNAHLIMPFGWENRYPKFYEHMTGFLRKFGANKHDDGCFVAGTKIATMFGDKNIEDIRKGDKVLTPYGYCKVIKSFATGVKPIITRFGLIGTENHKIFQQTRFAQLCDAKEELITKNNYNNLLQWRYKKLLLSTEYNTGLWGREGIIFLNQVQMQGERVLKDFMLRCGSSIMDGAFLKVIAFITRMAILLTTTSVIWSVYRLGSIFRDTFRKISKSQNIVKRLNLLLRKQEKRQRHGTQAKKEGNGIVNTQGQSTQHHDMRNPASFVEIDSCHTKKEQGSVLTNAEKNTDFVTCDIQESARNVGKNSNTERLNLRKGIEYSVASLVEQDISTNTGYSKRKEMVYNLTVDVAHCYYANGILVSNCDCATGVYEKEIATGNAMAYGMSNRGIKVH